MFVLSRARPRGRFVCLLGLLLLALIGCLRSKPALISAGPIDGVEDANTGGEAFRGACLSPRTIPVLSEAPNLAVVGTADFHPRFGLLVTDPIEKRVFRFDLHGRLATTLGRPGHGPGEFQELTDAVFLPDGGILALDGTAGVTLFDSNERVARALVGGRVFGGSTLVLLGGRRVIVGVGGAAPEPGAYMLARVLDLDSARFVGAVGRETWNRVRGIRMFRGVRLAADTSASLVAVAVPYRLGLDLVKPNGDSLQSWEGGTRAFRPPRTQAAAFASQAEANDWVLASSYLIGIALPDSSSVILAWDAYQDRRRHYYIGRYSRTRNALVSVDEIPYRFLRGDANELLFLDARSAPAYRVIICRGWAPGTRGSGTGRRP